MLERNNVTIQTALVIVFVFLGMNTHDFVYAKTKAAVVAKQKKQGSKQLVLQKKLKIPPKTKTTRFRSNKAEIKVGRTFLINFDEARPILKNLGVNFALWDKTTDHAGDFFFQKKEGEAPHKIFEEFGSRHTDEKGAAHLLSNFTYHLPQGTDIFSVSDGRLVSMLYQADSKDYELAVGVEKDATKDPRFVIVYTHISKPQVRLGSTVRAGDSIGEVSETTDTVAIKVLENAQAIAQNKNYCPLEFFDPSLREEYKQKISQLENDWKEFSGDQAAYNETKEIVPGCLYQSFTSAESARGELAHLRATSQQKKKGIAKK